MSLSSIASFGFISSKRKKRVVDVYSYLAEEAGGWSTMKTGERERLVADTVLVAKRKKKQKKLQLGAVGERLTFIYNGTWQTITVGNRNGVGYNGN